MNFTTEQIELIRQECKEETKEISDRVLNFIYDQQLFKLFVPEAFNGKMLDLPRVVKIFQDAAYIDGNFGWLITIGSGGGMFVPNMTEEAANKFYSPKNAVIAGSGFPAGTARPTEDGYILNGKWFYCSGSQYASLFTVTCVVENDNESKKEILAFALEPEQVDVLGDWDAFGLKSTSSHSIQVVNQFVPRSQAFSVFKIQNEHGGAVHTFPFVPFSEASFAAVSLGIGKHFLEEVEAILEKNKQNWQNGPINRYQFIKEKLHEEKTRWEKADNAFHSCLHAAWEQHLQEDGLPKEFEQKFSTIAKRSVTSVLHCANNLFRYIGMQAIMESNTLNQIWRDLHTASQHTFLIPYDEAESKSF